MQAIQVEKAALLRKGREVGVLTLNAIGHELVVSRGLIRTCAMKDEWYHDIVDPPALVEHLAGEGRVADVFTFIQRPPEPGPMFPQYCLESDNVAAIPLVSYEHWWTKQINSKTRALVRKASKVGVSVRPITLDELMSGIEIIYNETPIRQGKPFWHYNKDRDYLRRLHETYTDRSDFLGAFCEGQLIGFVKLVYAGSTANTMHIISMNAHRDKATNNALVAKAVEWCCAKGCTLLAYDKYEYESGGSASLLQFKRNNGFERVEYPRYFAPLTMKGRFAMQLGVHRGFATLLPPAWIDVGVRLRSRWYAMRKLHL